MVQQPQLDYSVTWVNRIADIPQAAWDALAQPLKTPFLEWEWLNNLETSGSATRQTGWLPNHLTVWRDRQLIAAAPLYIKSHSYGEFVFDHQWADLAYRLGVRYYPKLL
ncbi:MAG: N-acetyltransferase, partial [Coleofasciculus sp. Co-bin14]|nr:N-acetyltransferase [Coleofasciculus sp. Co-bin14]